MVELRQKRQSKTRPERVDVRGGWRGKQHLAEVRKKGLAPTPKRAVKLGRPLQLTDAALRRVCRTKIPGYNPWKVKDGCKFDVGRARAAINFFHTKLTHVLGKQARKPFYLEPWQQATIGNLFGWLNKDRCRRYRESLIYVPRKNGKSPLCAGILLYLLLEDGEYGAEIYGAASKYEQAALVFKHARGMVRNNPALEERCQVFKGQAKAIQLTDHTSNVDDVGVYRVISAEHNEGHGANMSGGVIDELHLQTSRDLVDSMRTATASEDRANPLMIYITTADFEREGSICNETHDYACKVRDGLVDDPTFLPVIYGASRDDDWTDEKVWQAANPNLGVSVSKDYLVKECKKAQETPSYENTFKRLHLNMRTEQATRWLAMDAWDACDTSINDEELANIECYAGLDLASTMDTTAFVMVFPLEDGRYAVRSHFWIPSKSAHERERRDRVPYLTWARQGHLTMTDVHEVTDYAAVRKGIQEYGERFKIREIAFDRWNSTQLVVQLSEDDGFDMIQFGQGYASMCSPSRELERLVIAKRLAHGGNPIMRWQASNVSVTRDPADNIKPDKKKSTEKIDGIVSLVMALGRAIVATDDSSVYSSRGIEFI